MSYSVWAVIIYLFFIGLAHLFTPPAFDWKRYPVSNMAARTYPKHWILTTGNILFSLILLTGIVFHLLKTNIDWMEQLPIAFFAFSILMSTLFRPSTFDRNQSFSDRQDTLHDLFILLAGLSFLIGILIYFVSVPKIEHKLVHFSFLVILSVSYLSYGIFSQFSGVVQRIILLISCIWLLFFY